MQEYKLRREQLAAMVDTPDLQLRKGADLLFRLAQEVDVPFHIFSAGIYDVIHAFLEHHNLNKFGMHVVSNMMAFDDDNVLQGFQGTLIHTMNKNSLALHKSPAWELVKVCEFARVEHAGTLLCLGRVRHMLGTCTTHAWDVYDTYMTSLGWCRIGHTCFCWGTTSGMWAWLRAWTQRSRSMSGS
jgi:hypothetical protein